MQQAQTIGDEVALLQDALVENEVFLWKKLCASKVKPTAVQDKSSLPQSWLSGNSASGRKRTFFCRGSLLAMCVFNLC